MQHFFDLRNMWLLKSLGYSSHGAHSKLNLYNNKGEPLFSPHPFFSHPLFNHYTRCLANLCLATLPVVLPIFV